MFASALPLPSLKRVFENHELRGESAVILLVSFDPGKAMLLHQRLFGGKMIRAIVHQLGENVFRNGHRVGPAERVIQFLRRLEQCLMLAVEQGRRSRHRWASSERFYPCFSSLFECAQNA